MTFVSLISRIKQKISSVLIVLVNLNCNDQNHLPLMTIKLRKVNLEGHY